MVNINELDKGQFVGNEWGYTDNAEVARYTMTEQDRKRWYHTTQACVMIGFKLDDDIAPMSDALQDEKGEWEWD